MPRTRRALSPARWPCRTFGRDKCGCGSGGNSNAPVRVDSEGDGGSVDQSNNVWSSGTAANLNGLGQGASQAQGGSGGIQAIGQDASNNQTAVGLSAALQLGASNSNSPVRVDSDGDGGDVSQSNNVGSRATGLNVNLTGQSAEQIQAGSCGCSERDRHPGDRPAGDERAGRCRALVRASGGCEQRQRPGERGQ